MYKTLKQRFEEINEAGDLHNVDCCCNDERGCDVDVELLDCCENMQFIKGQLQATIEERVESVAKAIYLQMPCDDPRGKPDWVERGNSLKQDEARSLARAALK